MSMRFDIFPQKTGKPYLSTLHLPLYAAAKIEKRRHRGRFIQSSGTIFVDIEVSSFSFAFCPSASHFFILNLQYLDGLGLSPTSTVTKINTITGLNCDSIF